jgi:hypothetical protein
MATTDVDLMDRVEEALRGHVLTTLPDPRGVLPSMSLWDLLSEYGTWRLRLPSRRPRKVHVSHELTTRRRTTTLDKKLTALIDAIQVGEDLASYVSKRVWQGYEAQTEERSLSWRPDRDLMLAEWGVNHLHLSPEHGNCLLFAIFRDNDAYLIDVCTHRDWARRAILEIMIRNWPDAGIVIKTGAIGLTKDWSDRDRKRLREHGISSAMIEFDGHVWAPASIGLTLDGTPVLVANAVMHLTWTLNDWREHLPERLAEAELAVNEALGYETAGEWTPSIYQGNIGIVRDGCFHPIAKLP